MADSATPRTADRPRLAVAYSGGRDSTALLHAVTGQAKEANIEVPAFGESKYEVLAFHIHHGLSTRADAWVAHAERQCAGWSVRLVTHYLSGRPAAGESIEAWAREARHAALAALCAEHGVDLLLLAHHRRDQAETLLLQALRGAGVAGLAAMPKTQWRDGICWARPWLDQPRGAIEAYVAAHGLQYVDDDSNADPRFARNRLRLAVWPALGDAFPQAESALAQSATWAQQALALQQEMATVDLAGRVDKHGLALQELQSLSPARAANALRAWLHEATGQVAPASLVQRIQSGEGGSGAAWPCADGLLRLYRGRLSWHPAPEAKADLRPSQMVNLGLPGSYAQPGWGGGWEVTAVPFGGVPAARLQDLTLRPRQGGEQFQRAPGSALRSLKKAYQEAGVPGWAREGPLLFSGAELVFAAGLGIDARVLAPPGEPQLSLRWLPVESRVPFTAP